MIHPHSYFVSSMTRATRATRTIAIVIAIVAGRAATAQVRPVSQAGERAKIDSVLTDSAFASYWELRCNGPVPNDSGIVFGTIRDAATRRPVPGAHVDVTWIELVADKKTFKRRQLKLDTNADSAGTYGLCGVPTEEFSRIGAGSAGRGSGLIDLPPTEQRLIRRDLMIGVETDSVARGAIVGTLSDSSGAPIPNARIRLDDAAESRSGDDGRFSFRSVPTGTRQIEVFSIGMVPALTTVDVLANDTTPTKLVVRRITALDMVRVSSSRRARQVIDEFEGRKRTGVGYSREAGDIIGHADLASVLHEFPSAQIDRNHGSIQVVLPDGHGMGCYADVWIDGARSAQEALTTLRMDEIMGIEMYVRAQSVPLKFQNPSNKTRCGALIIWTTWVFSR